MNRIAKNIALGVILMTSVSSCDLEVVPPSNIASETFWKTEKDAWYNLNACYSACIPGINIDSDTYSDDVYCQYPWESAGSTFITNGFGAGNDSGWNFESIRKTNIFLAEVDKCPISDALKTRMKAEVRCMRAWEYLNKTLTFGKVPLITNVPKYDDPALPRTDVATVRKFVLEELTAVAGILPENYSGGYLNEKGRLTKYAALALKARAALLFGDNTTAESTAAEVMKGGFSLFKVTTLTEAQQLELDEMDQLVDFKALGIDKEAFGLGMFSYEALWHSENGNPDNPEYIITRQHTAAKEQEDGTRYTRMRPSQLGGWSSLTPTQRLVDSYWTIKGETPELPSPEKRGAAYTEMKTDFDNYLKSHANQKPSPSISTFVKEIMANGKFKTYEYMKEFRNRDVRMYASILFPFKSWYETDFGKDFVYEWKKGGNNESFTGFSFRKLCCLNKDSNIDADEGSATGDFPSFRYAEILLIFAEARTNNTGFDAQVQSALNELRTRCGMPAVPTTLSKEDGLKLIRAERRIELAGEGARADDLVRYDKAYNNAQINNIKLLKPDNELILTMVWDERMRLRPIPQSAMDVNSLLKSDQNPGY